MGTADHHASANPAQAFGQCLDAFLQDAQATGMADGNHHEDEPAGYLIAIGPMDV